MRTKFAIVLAVAALCATTASADWTSDSLVSGTQMRRVLSGSVAHTVVYGTDGVGHLVWTGGPSSDLYAGVWYNRYSPGSGWLADFAIAPYSKKKVVGYSVPCIALDGDGRTIHVVWNARPMKYPLVYPDTLYYRMCTQDRKGNDKWGATLPLFAVHNLSKPVVACVPGEPGHVLVCWRHAVPIDEGGHSMVTRFREYVGGAWTGVVTLDSSYMGSTSPAAIAAAPNGDVFVAYDGYVEGTPARQIFVMTRHNGVWGEPVNVTGGFTSLHCWCHPIEADPTTGHPHVVFESWTEVPNGEGLDTVCAVYHTYRNSSGDWLTAPEVMSEPHSRWLGSHLPTMAYDSDGAAHVVWSETVPPSSVGIMYSYCPSEGGAWTNPEWLVSYDPDAGPSVTVEEPAHTVRVFWVRNGAGEYDDEIWWKSNYLGGGDGPGAQPMALSQSRIELFPNPAKAGLVNVQYSLPHAGQMTVTLVDISGRTVRRSAFDVRSSGTGTASVDVSGLAAGVYVARLVSRDLDVSKTLVVQR